MSALAFAAVGGLDWVTEARYDWERLRDHYTQLHYEWWLMQEGPNTEDEEGYITD